MAPKHKFYDIKHGGKDLPEDINSFVEEKIKETFRCAELDAKIIESRKKRRHTVIEYAEAHGKLGCKIEFIDGISPKFFLMADTPCANGGKIRETRSVLNSNLSFEKK